MATLLSVDWDAFFPTPAHDPLFLWDWGHRELRLFIDPDPIWVFRAAGFVRHGLPLPGLSGEQEGFWDRVVICPYAVLFFGESHAWAASEDVLDDVDEVWSFDAHHDGGYDDGAFERAFRGRVDCGSWLLAYWIHRAACRASCHVRYPAWRRIGDWVDTPETTPSFPDLDLGTAFAEGETLPVFDRVFVCRSGAWVPPWHDAAYAAFLTACPVADRVDLGFLGYPSGPRAWSEEAVQNHIEEMIWLPSNASTNPSPNNTSARKRPISSTSGAATPSGSQRRG